MAKTSLGYQVDGYSIAQSFYVENVKGIFLTAIDLYFKTVSTTTSLPVKMELRSMLNGQPTTTVIPGSLVTVNSSDVNYSTNASTATRFEFDEPIFLQGLRDYAFVMATNTSHYELFASVSDTFVIGSTVERISKQQTLGSLFFSQNATTFTAAQELDISFKLIRASFKHTEATATLRNASLPTRVLGLNPISVDSGDTRVVVSHPNHGFQPKDRVLIDINGGGTIAGIDSAALSGLHIIDSADFSGYAFRIATAANSTAVGGGNNVTVEKNIPYHKVYPGLQTLTPKGTFVTAGFKGTKSQAYNASNYGSTTATDRYAKTAQFQPIILNEDNTTDIPFAAISDRLEDSAGISAKSTELAITMSSDDSSISPVLDMQRASMILIGNQIDRQAATDTTNFNIPLAGSFVSESAATGGSSASKHLTKVVTLSEDAVGLKIILGANRPVDTDFQVWFRTASQDENIATNDFTLLAEETTNPTDTDPTIFRDYEYLAGGIEGNLTAFKKFQIKIEMRSINQAKAPTFQDLRIIALSV